MTNSDLYLLTGSVGLTVLAFVGIELLSVAIRRAARVAGAKSAVIRDIRDGFRIIALAIAASAVLSFTGLASEFTALTISGIAGVAVSLALQNTLSNIIAGILMLHDGVLKLGDTIEYGGSLKGKVIRVALRNTWITMDDGAVAVISNSNLSSGPLVNHTAKDRLRKKFGIDG
jgi:small conductance mechanosensitive channel